MTNRELWNKIWDIELYSELFGVRQFFWDFIRQNRSKTKSESLGTLDTRAKEHSVRFTDEGTAMITMFEQQKLQMEQLLADARAEYQSQLEELKQNQSKVIESSLSTITNSSNSTNSISQHETTRNAEHSAEQLLSGAQQDMDRIQAYQAEL